MADWRMKGEYLKNCGCAFGCPCDFWAEPTRHSCDGISGMRILEGHFEQTPLTGLIWIAASHWPGPLHQGNGVFQTYISESASEAQRSALLTILSGRAGSPWFELLASLAGKIHRPKFVPIEWEFDLERRRARVRIAGEVETVTRPIRVPGTGEEHRIRVEMPAGIEYRNPETAEAEVLRSTGPIAFDFRGVHSSLAIVEHSAAGAR